MAMRQKRTLPGETQGGQDVAGTVPAAQEADATTGALARGLRKQALSLDPVWLPWREMNGERPSARSGTWIQEEGETGDCVHLVDFCAVEGGWVLREGTIDKATLQSDAFCGWNPEYENATNGWQRFESRAGLDAKLSRLGIKAEATGASMGPLRLGTWATPVGVLRDALTGPAGEGSALRADIRSALEAVKSEGSFLHPHPENDASYLPLLRRVAEDAAVHPEVRERAGEVLLNWFREGQALPRGLIFPNVRRAEELFMEIRPYEVEKTRDPNRQVSPYLRVTGPKGVHLGACSVKLWPEALDGLQDRMLSVVEDPDTYFGVYLREDGRALVVANYNRIIGGRTLALLDPEGVRALEPFLATPRSDAGGEAQGEPTASNGNGKTRVVGNTIKIGDEAADVLSRSTLDGNMLRLPEGQLDRKVYEDVKKVLETLGGKWKTGPQAFVFPKDPGMVLAEAMENGHALIAKKHFQLFETPHEVAARMASMADLKADQLMLEPSGGGGRILQAMIDQVGQGAAKAGRLHACELDQQHWEGLTRLGAQVQAGDFLGYQPGPVYDRIVANPPFTNQQDLKHASHMLDCLKPGGRLVTVLAAGFSYRSDRRTEEFKARLERECSHFEVFDLNSGVFRESGTNVATVLLVADKKTLAE